MLDLANPDLYRINAFRVTGLPVRASAREVARHTDKLKLIEELGESSETHATAFALKPPPSIDQIRASVHRIRDPILRLLDEFFWFWPLNPDASNADQALVALEGGDVNAAIKVWESLESHPTQGVAAMHNLAVCWHICALDKERDSDAHPAYRDLDQLWQDSLKRWNLLADDDGLWELVVARVRQLDDPQLSTGFVRRMRATLPTALCTINAALALRYAEEDISAYQKEPTLAEMGVKFFKYHGEPFPFPPPLLPPADQTDRAQKHISLMRATGTGCGEVDVAIEMVLSPLYGRLRQQIDSAIKSAEEGPVDLISVCSNLTLQTRKTISVVKRFYEGHSAEIDSLANETAEACNRLALIYHAATSDDASCLEALTDALPLATSEDLREKLTKAIETLRRNLESEILKPLYALLNDIHNNNQAPYLKLKTFRDKLEPRLRELESDQFHSEAIADLEDFVAVVLRSISVSAWNDYKDGRTANDAHKMAYRYARSMETKLRLAADDEALTRNGVGQNTDDNIAVSMFAIVFLVIIFMVVIKDCSSQSPSVSRGSTYTPKSDSRPTTVKTNTPPPLPPSKTIASSNDSSPREATVADGVRVVGSMDTSASNRTSLTDSPPSLIGKSTGITTQNSYRIHQSRAPELHADRRLIDTAREKLATDRKAVDALGRELEYERQLLRGKGQPAIDEFNRKVDRYNALLAEARKSQSSVNELVESYNAKLQRYSR
jgi:hypothetical protein